MHKSKDAFVHAVPLLPGHLVTFTAPETGVMKPLLKALPQSADDGPAAGGRGAGHGSFFRRRQPQGELIAGVAVDSERLYILTATRVFGAAPQEPASDEPAIKKRAGKKAGKKKKTAVEPPGTTTPGAKPPPADAADAAKPILIGHQFKVHAFALKDGTALMGDGYELALVNENPNATEPPDTTNVTETLGKGPIELIDGGLKCRGTTVIFSGNEVKSLEVKGRQFTPPPGFFARDPDVRTF